MAMLTIMGMYNFDNTIFDSMYLPTGVDRMKMIQNIILETAELETVYPAPSFFKSAVGLWSNCQAFTWDRIYSASQLEYDPIENYNRYESETTGSNKTRTGSDEGSSENSLSRTGSGNDSTVTDADKTISRTGSGNDSTVTDGEKSVTVSATENRDTTTNQTTTNDIAGFDSNTLVPHDKSTVNGTGSDDFTRSGTEKETNDITVTGTRSETASETESNDVTVKGTRSETVTETNTTTNENSSTETLTDAGTRESHIHGNIGVTTSQQMLESELEVAPKLNIYSYITNEFKKRFCVLVY